ncbi:MAG: stage V sporulation protein AB [Lachnospiraceae bacterium]|nr:stage V sporulation protein AB [Lachnospiraceae bacterium]
MRFVILGIIGLMSGVGVAGGLFAFIVAIGVIQRLIVKSRTINYERHYENCIIWGATIANIVYVFRISIPLGIAGIVIYGTFAGMYIGTQAMALAETIKLLPIAVRRTKIKHGLQYIVTAMACGKIIGSAIGLIMNK